MFFRSLLALTMNDFKMTSTSTFADMKDELFVLGLLSKLRQWKHVKHRHLPAGHRNTDLSFELKTFCVEMTLEIVSSVTVSSSLCQKINTSNHLLLHSKQTKIHHYVTGRAPRPSDIYRRLYRGTDRDRAPNIVAKGGSIQWTSPA